MDADDEAVIRDLYAQACDGPGAALKWVARDRLEMIMDEAGLDMGLVFESLGLDAAAYAASSPPLR